MTRNHDDTESYHEAVARHLAVLVAAEVALLKAAGEEYDEAEIEEVMEHQARGNADVDVQAAHDNAEACLHNSYMFDREFA